MENFEVNNLAGNGFDLKNNDKYSFNIKEGFNFLNFKTKRSNNNQFPYSEFDFKNKFSKDKNSKNKIEYKANLEENINEWSDIQNDKQIKCALEFFSGETKVLADFFEDENNLGPNKDIKAQKNNESKEENPILKGQNSVVKEFDKKNLIKKMTKISL